jgi:hypothetical protein
MLSRLHICLCLLLMTCALASLDAMAAVPKGQRLLGIDISNSANATYDNAMLLAKSAGMEFTQLSLSWDSVESANTSQPGGTIPGVYSSSGWNFSDGYYPAYQVALALNLNPLDTNNNRIPSDLQALPFDHPSVISRYEQAADFVLSQLPHVTVVSFAVGNEVDASLTTSAQWTQYTVFYQTVASYLRNHHPGLKVGVKATFTGLTQSSQAYLLNLNQFSDTLLVTYYPINANFSVKDPSLVETDFATLTGLYPAKPIGFLEAGYQSATTCASSEALQTAFIDHLFNAWDQQASHVQMVNYLWLHDRSLADVDQFSAYYGLYDPRFREYLRTLGLRNYDGTDKPAFAEFKNQAAARGWATDFTPTTTPTATATPAPQSTPPLHTATPTADFHGGIAVYPSPARNQATFAFENDNGEAATIRIYSSAGERIALIFRPAGTVGNMVWNCAQAATGVYIVRLERKNQRTQQLKLAVTH